MTTMPASYSELLSRIPLCQHGKPEFISIVLLSHLLALENKLGYKLKFTSGYRCEECNKKVGGVTNSAHIRGKAVDIAVYSSAERWRLLNAIFHIPFLRVGIGKSFIHVDVDEDLPQNVAWLY